MANVTGKICALLVATAATAAALSATTALAGSGVGATFNLGQTNTVDATSILTGSSAAGQLKVQNNSTAAATFGVFGLINPTAPGANSVAVKGQNNGTGNAGTGVTGTHAGGGTGVFGTAATGIGVYGKHTAATGSGPGVKGESVSGNAPALLGLNTGGGPALALLVNSGKAPFTVNSSTKVANMNADFLDGLDGSAFWRTAGNAGTTASNFVGTTTNQPLVFKTNAKEAMRINAAGNVGIGTSSPSEKLEVTGGHVRVRSSTVLAEDFEGTTFPPAGWTLGESMQWSRDTSVKYSGAASASGLASGGNSPSVSELNVNVTLPAAGAVRFRWKVEDNPGLLEGGGSLGFCVDPHSGPGSCRGEITGHVDWTEMVVPLSAGSHELMWYVSQVGGSNGAVGWVDAVSVEYGGGLTAAGDLRAGGRVTGTGTALGMVRYYGGFLSRCYRGDEGSTLDNYRCMAPWSLSGSGGQTTVTFPFRVDDRFVVVTPEYAAGAPVMATYDFPAANQVRVRTWTCGGGSCGPIASAYSLAVF